MGINPNPNPNPLDDMKLLSKCLFYYIIFHVSLRSKMKQLIQIEIITCNPSSIGLGQKTKRHWFEYCLTVEIRYKSWGLVADIPKDCRAHDPAC